MHSNYTVIAVADSKKADNAPQGAKNTAAKNGGGLGLTIPMLIIVAAVFIMMFRSQKKQQQQRQQLMDGMKVGDSVISAGGIYGKIAVVKKDSFILEIANGVRIEIAKAGVTSKIVPEGEAPAVGKK